MIIPSTQSGALPPSSAAEADGRRCIGRRWTRDEIPSQEGRRVLVTGGTRGLGRATALALASRGADVVITGTRADAAAASAQELARLLPAGPGSVTGVALDLSRPESVAAAAAGLAGPVDCLIANAGIMWGPFGRTSWGVERQLAINFLGHFALIGHLLPALLAGRDPRVVCLSSTYHRFGSLAPAALDVDERHYRPNRAYGTSKLAMLVFVRELARRAQDRGLGLTAVAAHPGYANTDLQTLQIPAVQRPVMRAANALVAVPVDVGADPVLCAASVPGLPGGLFIGPTRLGGYRGRPGVVDSSPAARDGAAAGRLWAWASERAGVAYLSE